MKYGGYLQTSSLAFLFILTWGIEGCMSSPPPARIIQENSTQFVRLEVTPSSSKQERHHPGTISQETLAHIFRTITIETRPPSPEQPGFAYISKAPGPTSSNAFTSKEVEYLAQQLSKALQQATPLEDVVFYLDARHQQNKIHELTTGRVYLQEGELHIHIANYRHPIVGTSEISKIKAQPLTVFALPQYTLVPGPRGKIIREKGWRTTLTAFPQHLVFPRPDTWDFHFSTDKKAISRKSRTVHQSFSEQLRELQSLRDEGHLSESEFQTLRKRLLDKY